MNWTKTTSSRNYEEHHGLLPFQNRSTPSCKEQLQKSREETIEKWGEKLEKSKKNTSTDFEIFYKDAIARVKNIFGRNFDLRKPKTDEEKIYAEYIEDAIKYYRD
jgi:hypothetical protein